MPLDIPTSLPPLGDQTEPDQVRVAAVVGGQLGSAPARGFGLTPDERAALETLTAGGSATAQTRSRIVNGAMQISQELAKESGNGVVSVIPYVADQWVMNAVTGATAALGICTASTTVPGVNWRLHLYAGATPDTSIAAGDIARIYQPIEGIRIADFGWGTASAQQVILRFTARSTMAGTFCVSLKNSTGLRSYVKNCVLTAANADQEFTLVIPGATTGTWLITTAVGVYLEWDIMSGTNNQGVEGWQAGNFGATSAISNFFGTANTSFYLSKVGLYIDPNNTGVAPAWQMPDEAEELRACQRYWYQIAIPKPLNSPRYGLAGTTAAEAGYIPFLVQMRTTPAATILTAPGLVNSTAFALTADTTPPVGMGATVNVTATGNYRAHTGSYAANARM